MKLLFKPWMWKLLVSHCAVSDHSFARECNECAPLWVCSKAVRITVAMDRYPLLSTHVMDMDLCCVRLVTWGNPSFVQNPWALQLKPCYMIWIMLPYCSIWLLGCSNNKVAGNDLVMEMSVNSMKLFYLGVSCLGFMVSILRWQMLITITVSLNDGNIWIFIVEPSEGHYLQYSLNLACSMQHRLLCSRCAMTTCKQLPPFRSIIVPSSSGSSIPSRVDCLTLMMKALGSFKLW